MSRVVRVVWIQGFKGLVGQLSGHTIKKELAQYSEVYGEALLGMHRDLEPHQVLIEGHDLQQGLTRVIQAEGQLSQAVTQAEDFIPPRPQGLVHHHFLATADCELRKLLQTKSSLRTWLGLAANSGCWD